MISTFRLPLLACLAAPVAAHGAAYECTVDGRTAYQQLPRASAGIASRAEIGEVPVNEPSRVHFATTISEPGGSSASRVADRAFSVGLQREANGRTCVNGFGSVVRRAS